MTNAVTSEVSTTTVSQTVTATERGPGVTVPPTLAFAGGFAAAWWLDGVAPLPLVAVGSSAVTAAGWLLIGLGTAVFLWALRAFFVVRTGIMLQKPATHLMTAGPYAWSRNPQYVAFVALYVGAALLVNTAWPLVWLPLVLLLVGRSVIAREERYLRTAFGQSYDDYCRTVGRWL
jgi:protein-S-isoprenylcysteine O-methyltransferase Ste14